MRGGVGTFGPGNNVFSTLQGGTSINSSNSKQMSVMIPGQFDHSKQNMNTSVDVTTNHTGGHGGVSFRQSPGVGVP